MSQISYHYIAPLVLFRAVQSDLPAFCQLSQTFLEIAPPMFARLETAMQGGVGPKLAQACHSLRGATALVGAVKLTDLLTAMEAAARAGQTDYDTGQLPELRRLFGMTVQEVQLSIVHFKGLEAEVAQPDPAMQSTGHV